MMKTLKGFAVLALLAPAVVMTGCEEACKSEDAALEVSVRLSTGVDEAAIAKLEARVLAVGMDKTYQLQIKDRRASFRVEVGAVGEEDFIAQVRIRALDKNKAILAEATAALENTADACNRHEVILEAVSADSGAGAKIDAATPDAGADAAQAD